MHELRQNPISKEWVIIAPERARRPQELIAKHPEKKPLPRYAELCPFCPGNEEMAPPESMHIARNGNWQVRVVPNKFAALSMEGSLSHRIEGMKRTVSGVGFHDVVVETPDHSKTLALLEQEEVEVVIRAYKERYFSITTDPRIEQVTIFKNHGTDAGTSLEHSHSQIMATPIISGKIRGRMEEALRFYDENGQCIYCKVMAEETADGVRIVEQSDHFLAFVPYASLSPFSMYIFPRRHMASFGEIHPEEMRDLAGVLRSVLAKLYYGLANPDYNYVIRTAPSENRYSRYYHWYISLIPRLTHIAGFELGSGMYVNVTLPEVNAEFLRNVEIPAAGVASVR